MLLKDLRFSDIILLSKGGGAYLKGTPEQDQKLVAAPEECAHEAGDLLKVVGDLFKSRDPNVSLRVTHLGCSYRAAMYDDVVGGHAFFLRRLADVVPSLDDLGLPKALADWLTDSRQCKGLLLIAGGQGAGKTTTASALIKSRLTLHGGHAVSFENPVEMPLSGSHGPHGYCFQSEIQSEAELEGHIERAHRYSSPNIIYIGEIRSKYAASVALSVALGSSQQLVVATIHGLSINAALKRLITWAREQDGEVACQNLSQSILCIVHQELSDLVNAKRELKLPEFLLVPFDKVNDDSASVRNKLAEGNLNLSDMAEHAELRGEAVAINYAMFREAVLNFVFLGLVEAHSGQESFYGYAARQKPKIMAALESSKTWEEFHQALLKIGIHLELRGNGLAMKDRHGKHRAKPSEIDRNLAKRALEKKLGPFKAAAPKLLQTVKSVERYTAVPLHLGPDRDNLYEEFKVEMAERKSKLEGIKTEESEAFQAIRQRWNAKREVLQKYPMLYAHRQQLLLEMKIKEQEEIMANRTALAEKRQGIREAIPYTSWAKYLQHKAAQGNEVALAVLRSKKVKTEPETETKNAGAVGKTYDEITLESLTRQKKILSLAEFNSAQKKALLSVEKMRTVLEKERLFGGNTAALKNYRIDTKGTVLFSFDNGSSIRDTGKEIHFTANDEQIRKLAMEFSRHKWGKQFVLKDGMIVFDASTRRKDISR